MRLIHTLSLALAFAAATALPAFAQPAPQAPTATKTFNLTLHGDVPAGESFGIEYAVKGGSEQAPLYFCGPDVGTQCTGNGTVHTQSVSVPDGSQLLYRFYRGHVYSPSFEEISSGEEVITANSASHAAYTFTPAASSSPSASPSPDAPVPPDTVTLTLNLTVNGEVPPGAGFSVIYGELAIDSRAGDTLCGTVVKGTRPDCVGDGTVYTEQIAVPRGTTFAYIYYIATSSMSVGQPFDEGSLLMDEDKTINATYTFATATPAPSATPSVSAKPSASAAASATAKPSASATAKPSSSTAPIAAQLPDTGVGMLPVGGALAAALALLGGGFAVRKRR